jgi:lipopolysaccharide export system permease protein
MGAQFFPSRTLAIYMAKMLLLRSFAILFALVLILQTLDLLGESGNVLAYQGNGSSELWTYVSLRMPQIIAFVLPFSMLLGTLITLATLNQNSEVVSMKAAGLSAHQVLAPLILASMIVAAISFTFNDRVVTRATATLSKWEKNGFAPLPKDKKALVNVWVRDGDDLIRAGIASGQGLRTRLEDVTIYDRTGGMLNSIVEAKSASFSGTGWVLSDAKRFDVATGKSSELGRIITGNGVRPDQFLLSSVNPDGLSFFALRSAIGDLEAAGRPTSALKASLWHKISKPLSALLMPLLGAVAAFGVARSGRLFVRAAIGMALGFAYFVADNFGIAMGNLGAYPPLLAAWGPFALFLLIGEAVLIQTEE